MRRIARHPKYLAKRAELASKYPNFLGYIELLEELIAESPEWPTSICVPAYNIWWSHFLVEDESIPHMRVFHSFDEAEVRLLAIVQVEERNG